MRKMPQIPEIEKQIRMTNTFGGYNHKEIITDGEMFDTKNLSADMYPIVTTRRKRSLASYDTAGQAAVPLTGLHGRDQLVMIRGTEVFYNFTKVNGLSVSAESNMLPKKIVSMGAYVCIWPDKVYFNTIDSTDYGSMERKLTIGGANVSLAMCRADGTNYDMTQITVSSSAPANPTNGKLWIDQSGDVDVLRQYTASTQEWTEVPTVYVKISGTGVGQGLKEYDAITISGMEAVSGSSAKVTAQVAGLNGSQIVYGAGSSYVIVVGLISATQAALKSQNVTINRTVPDLDYICESNNRLWGCKYGMENGQVVNEIRASKLGDFRNWSCFMGLSTDSYTASIGTDGVWTGAVSQKGYPVFFKENFIHRVSGNTPSSFQISSTACRGVQRGCWRSIAVAGERIIYKSRQDVMAYDGSLPMSVSEQLGGVLYSDARAGAVGDTYYISMKDSSGRWSLFTYNIEKQIWYREDGLHVREFGAVGDELFAIDEENNLLCALRGTMGAAGWTQEADFEWKAEFGISGVEYVPGMYGVQRNDTAGSHYLSRFDIRMYLEEGSRAELEIQYDANGEWTKQGSIQGNRMKTFVLPVVPKRCDHLRFRMRGNGGFRIYSITRRMEVGSDG
jgi:hypothetical protein